MKKFLNKIKRNLSNMAVKLRDHLTMKYMTAKTLLCSQRGEGFVDTAIKILMAVVIGALILAGLYALFGETILFSSRSKHDRKCYA